MKLTKFQRAILDFLRLRALSNPDWAYGLEIKKSLYGKFWFVDGRIYPNIRAMERLGFIETEQTSPPDRFRYRITRAAIEVLDSSR